MAWVDFDAAGRPFLHPPDGDAYAFNRRFWDTFFFRRGSWPRRLASPSSKRMSRRLGGETSFDPGDPAVRQAGLEFLLGRMRALTRKAGAHLVVVYIPYLERGETNPPPPALAAALRSVTGEGVTILDLAPVVARYYADPAQPLLRFERDAHPNPAGHALIADALEGALRRERASSASIMSAMEYRPLGRTGLDVSAIGYGAWGIGGGLWVGAEDAESLRALHRAVDLGVNFVDTAYDYGQGRSEALVGQVIRERRETILVATKIPPKNRVWPAAPDVPVSECFPGRSHRRVRGPLPEEPRPRSRRPDAAPHLARLVPRPGRLARRLPGAEARGQGPVPRPLGERPRSRVGDARGEVRDLRHRPGHLQHLRPLARARAASRLPRSRGGRAGPRALRRRRRSPAPSPRRRRFPEGDFRNQYFGGDRKRQVHERVQRLRGLLGEEAATLPELALRFCLSHDAVSTVIPGMRRISSVEANAAAGDGRRLSKRLLEELGRHAWPRNFYS